MAPSPYVSCVALRVSAPALSHLPKCFISIYEYLNGRYVTESPLRLWSVFPFERPPSASALCMYIIVSCKRQSFSASARRFGSLFRNVKWEETLLGGQQGDKLPLLKFDKKHFWTWYFYINSLYVFIVESRANS